MTHKVLISGRTDLLLWGISPHFRIERQLRSMNIHDVTIGTPSDDSKIFTMIIDGGYVFDSLLMKLFQERNKPCALIYDNKVVALNIISGENKNFDSQLGIEASNLPEYFEKISPSDSSTYNDHLRRSEPLLLMPATLENVDAIEDRLYGNSYKGITDFVTKWIWPKPAKKAVRVLSNHSVSPNNVTLFSLLLVITSSVLFANGHFISGLIMGWMMTFLDTVDGKLARVTITSSRVGHLLDHGMDIIHPPIWYACWINGLLLQSHISPETAQSLNLWIIIGYVVGRLVEGLFHLLGNCSIFAWRPIDAICRLFTARRNPCLLFLSMFMLFGMPEVGLLAVCGWTIFSSAALILRFFQAVFIRIRSGPLESWLENEEEAMKRNPSLYKAFSSTLKAYE